MSRNRNVPDALAVINSRKSVRSFTGEAVSGEDLEEILRAGMPADRPKEKYRAEMIHR